jgi:hypothetical protein
MGTNAKIYAILAVIMTLAILKEDATKDVYLNFLISIAMKDVMDALTKDVMIKDIAKILNVNMVSMD